ncbi:MAG: thrombospondin type 3 repeat-containing protein, partial [Myxococcales bacterium]|nr:thrombospondin type 3 repeat-containing protein [Myxococcales bacterium]
DADDDASDASADTADTADTVEPGPCPGGGGAVIGASGGVAAYGGATLTVPAGALAADTTLCITAVDGAPSGYTAYSPVYAFAPDGLVFLTEATLDIALTEEPPDNVALFLSRASGPAYEWVGARVSGSHVSGPMRHFSEAFAGDGADYVDPPDPTCARTRLLEGRTVAPAGVALFVTVDDCHGTPLTALTPADFAIDEDGAPLTSESAVGVLANDGVAVFVTLVIDMSSSTAAELPDLIAAARAFVTRVMVDDGLPVRVAIEVFSGGADVTTWQDYHRDPATLLARLDALATYAPPDPTSTNLNGAVIAALTASGEAQAAFRAENRGGAFTIGHVVLFTDGRDTASWKTPADVLVARADSPDEIVAVGLESADYDEQALMALAPGGVFTARDGGGLAAAFGALANRIGRQVARTYLIGYCSPKKNAEHDASVRIAGLETDAATFTFDATGFTAGCTTAIFTDACAERECGGLGCGACDEREAICTATGRCLSYCTTACSGGAGTFENPHGYPQDCPDECDKDWLTGDDDNCPFATNADQRDRDIDGVGDACDPDIDGDGVANAADRCNTAAPGWLSTAETDHDGDGCDDATDDTDDDNDGKLDTQDACPLGDVGWTSDTTTDHDHDGCQDDGEDDDDDNDGKLDAEDGCPRGRINWNRTSLFDQDDDGCYDVTEDDDDDGDGVLDADDACHYSPRPPLPDYEHDGCADVEDYDDDDDGLNDADDACPRGGIGLGGDRDGDGCKDTEDADDDDDGVPDTADRCPVGAVGWAPSPATDLDGDGCRDADEDLDDDGDGVPDDIDPCLALVGTQGEDQDRDGCGADVDDDDDGDGVADEVDPCPGSFAPPGEDLDHDGCPDAEDRDDDGDGVDDDVDPCPHDAPAPRLDPDGDGCANLDIGDGDADGIPDAHDVCIGEDCLCGAAALCVNQEDVLPVLLRPLALAPDGGLWTGEVERDTVYAQRLEDDGTKRGAPVPLLQLGDIIDVPGYDAVDLLVHQLEITASPSYAAVLDVRVLRTAFLPEDPTAPESVDGIFAWYVGLDPAGEVAFAVRRESNEVPPAVRDADYTAITEDELVRVALVDGAEIFRVPFWQVDEETVLMPERLLATRSGRVFVAGEANYGAGTAFVGEVDESGALAWWRPLGATCGTVHCDAVDALFEAGDGRLLVTTKTTFRVVVDPDARSVLERLPLSEESTCRGDGQWVDGGCRVAVRAVFGGADGTRLGVDFCGAEGLASELARRHGGQYPAPLSAVVTTTGVRILGVEAVTSHPVLLTVGPCGSAASPCEDDDMCTVDSGAGGAECVHEFEASAICGACANAATCDDGVACTVDGCFPWGSTAGCFHNGSSCGD